MKIIPKTYKLFTPYFINKPVREDTIRCKNEEKILNEEDYEMILENNYTIKYLNDLKKKHSIIGGKTKGELIYLIYNILRIRCGILKIKKCYRRYLLYKYKKLLNGQEYRNTEDFETLESLKNLIKLNIVSLSDDESKCFYGFHIKSFKKLLKKYKKKAFNPYTRKLINDDEEERINKILRLNKILNIPSDNLLEEEEVINSSNKLRFNIIDVVHELNNLGNYVESSWLEKLTKAQLVKFFFELKDIWEYRANLSSNVKFQIYKFGNPFYDINLNMIRGYTEDKLKFILINLIRRFISSDEETVGALGAFYILGTLTLVEMDARNALPWLYQSFYYAN